MPLKLEIEWLKWISTAWIVVPGCDHRNEGGDASTPNFWPSTIPTNFTMHTCAGGVTLTVQSLVPGVDVSCTGTGEWVVTTRCSEKSPASS